MSQDPEDRYREIMRQIARRRAEQALEPAREQQTDLKRVLDGLDAWGKLLKLKQSGALRPSPNGPRLFDGLKPQPWIGVLLWRRGPGYYGYKVLQIVGVWALRDTAGPPLIVVGARRVAYAAPTYEAEAYHKLLRKNFTVYYRDDGSPPPPVARLFAARYAADHRLDLRDQIRDTLAQWAANN